MSRQSRPIVHGESHRLMHELGSECMAKYRFVKEEVHEYASPVKGRYARILFDQKVIPGAQCSMGVFRFEPGVVAQAHQHEAEVEVYFGLQGEGEVTIDGEPHRFGPGVAVYVPPKAVHQTRNAGDEVLEFTTFFSPAVSMDFVRDWER